MRPELLEPLRRFLFQDPNLDLQFLIEEWRIRELIIPEFYDQLKSRWTSSSHKWLILDTVGSADDEQLVILFEIVAERFHDQPHLLEPLAAVPEIAFIIQKRANEQAIARANSWGPDDKPAAIENLKLSFKEDVRKCLELESVNRDAGLYRTRGRFQMRNTSVEKEEMTISDFPRNVSLIYSKWIPFSPEEKAKLLHFLNKPVEVFFAQRIQVEDTNCLRWQQIYISRSNGYVVCLRPTYRVQYFESLPLEIFNNPQAFEEVFKDFHLEAIGALFKNQPDFKPDNYEDYKAPQRQIEAEKPSLRAVKRKARNGRTPNFKKPRPKSEHFGTRDHVDTNLRSTVAGSTEDIHKGITRKLVEQFVKHEVSEFLMEWNPNVELSSACMW